VFLPLTKQSKVGAVVGMASGCVASQEAYLVGIIAGQEDDSERALIATKLQELQSHMPEYLE
jgi:hypothetical protein